MSPLDSFVEGGLRETHFFFVFAFQLVCDRTRKERLHSNTYWTFEMFPFFWLSADPFSERHISNIRKSCQTQRCCASRHPDLKYVFNVTFWELYAKCITNKMPSTRNTIGTDCQTTLSGMQNGKRTWKMIYYALIAITSVWWKNHHWLILLCALHLN